MRRPSIAARPKKRRAGRGFSLLAGKCSRRPGALAGLPACRRATRRARRWPGNVLAGRESFAPCGGARRPSGLPPRRPENFPPAGKAFQKPGELRAVRERSSAFPACRRAARKTSRRLGKPFKGRENFMPSGKVAGLPGLPPRRPESVSKSGKVFQKPGKLRAIREAHRPSRLSAVLPGERFAGRENTSLSTRGSHKGWWRARRRTASSEGAPRSRGRGRSARRTKASW
jgi:hypothetical protein